MNFLVYFRLVAVGCLLDGQGAVANPYAGFYVNCVKGLRLRTKGTTESEFSGHMQAAKHPKAPNAQ